jgi:hypothetical protein
MEAYANVAGREFDFNACTSTMLQRIRLSHSMRGAWWRQCAVVGMWYLIGTISKASCILEAVVRQWMWYLLGTISKASCTLEAVDKQWMCGARWGEVEVNAP